MVHAGNEVSSVPHFGHSNDLAMSQSTSKLSIPLCVSRSAAIVSATTAERCIAGAASQCAMHSVLLFRRKTAIS